MYFSLSHKYVSKREKKDSMKKRVIILMCLLGCLATGCGNKEASGTKTFTASNTDSISNQSNQEQDLDNQTSEVEKKLETQTQTQALEQEPTEKESEKLQYYSPDITNLPDMAQKISENQQGSIGYLVEYAKEKGYQKFALLVSNDSLYDTNLATKLADAQAPFSTSFCLLAYDIDGNYTYFTYSYNETSKTMEITDKPMVNTSNGKKVESIGMIPEGKILYTEIKNKKDDYEIFSTESGNISVRNKAIVKVYLNGVEDSINATFDSFKKTYKKYLSEKEDLVFTNSAEDIRQY